MQSRQQALRAYFSNRYIYCDFRDPVSSLEDLLESDIKLVISANSSIQEYFSDAEPSSTPGKCNFLDDLKKIQV